MELFHEYKNKYFNLIFTILSFGEKGITEKEITKIIKEQGYNSEEFIDKSGCTLREMILNKCIKEENNLNLLEEKRGKYYSKIRKKGNNPLRVRFTTVEKQWLKDLIGNKEAKELLGKELVHKIEKELNDISALSTGNIQRTNSIINKNKVEDRKFSIKFFKILQAITEERYINYSYKENKNGAYNKRKAIPFRIEYSLRENRFKGIFYLEEEDRIVVIDIEDLTDISLGENIKNYSLREDIFIKIKDKYVDEPIVLQVKDEKAAMERFFMSFSSYERYAKVIEENIYEIELYYYIFQKEEVIRKIISLGPYVKVKSPNNIIEEMVEKIKRAYELSI